MKKYSLNEIRRSLAENNLCYILITCGELSVDGKMDAEMFYEGDEALASYLIGNAQQVIDSEPQFEKPSLENTAGRGHERISKMD